MTDQLKQEILKEFEKGCNTDNISDPPSDKEWIKSFLSQAIDQTRQEVLREILQKLEEKRKEKKMILADAGMGQNIPILMDVEEIRETLNKLSEKK